MEPDHPLLLPILLQRNLTWYTPERGAIRAGQSSALGQRTVGFQDPVGNRGLVMDHEIQNAFALALLDQLEDLGTNIKEHHRRLRSRQYSAIPQIDY